MFLIYSILYAIVSGVLFIPQYVKRPQALRKKWLHEKLGYLPSLGSALWIHAVSVGEVHASIPLLKKLREKYGNIPILFSTITDTGQHVAREKAPEGTTVVYLPFDMPFILNRCLKSVQPRIFIVMETELWPNIFRTMGEREIPVLVLNGRISEKSAKGYCLISVFMKKVFSYVTRFAVQARSDADRLVRIGADKNVISVNGNFKFDVDIAGLIPEWVKKLGQPLIVAGSTHRGEEELMLSVYRNMIGNFPNLKIVIAPRHPERFKEVEMLLADNKIPFVKRSELEAQQLVSDTFVSGIVLLDTIGELAGVYGAADIAIMGKSFNGFGGQNPLEPAYWGKPIICGPHMENFQFIEEFYQIGAAFRVDADALSRTVHGLLASPEKAAAAGKKARDIYEKHSGAVDRAMDIIDSHIGASP